MSQLTPTATLRAPRSQPGSKARFKAGRFHIHALVSRRSARVPASTRDTSKNGTNSRTHIPLRYRFLTVTDEKTHTPHTTQSSFPHDSCGARDWDRPAARPFPPPAPPGCGNHTALASQNQPLHAHKASLHRPHSDQQSKEVAWLGWPCHKSCATK